MTTTKKPVKHRPKCNVCNTACISVMYRRFANAVYRTIKHKIGNKQKSVYICGNPECCRTYYEDGTEFRPFESNNHI